MVAFIKKIAQIWDRAKYEEKNIFILVFYIFLPKFQGTSISFFPKKEVSNTGAKIVAKERRIAQIWDGAKYEEKNIFILVFYIFLPKFQGTSISFFQKGSIKYWCKDSGERKKNCSNLGWSKI